VVSLLPGKVNISASIAEELIYCGTWHRYFDLQYWPVVISLSLGKVNNEEKKYKFSLNVYLKLYSNFSSHISK